MHSRAKTDYTCLLMVSSGMTSRDTGCLLLCLRPPCMEPVPGHATISRHPAGIPTDWLEDATARTARMCIGEAGLRMPMVAADSTGVETGRYGTAVRPDRDRSKFAPKTARTCLKWHVLAMPETGTVLASRITPGRTGDSPLLRKRTRSRALFSQA